MDSYRIIVTPDAKADITELRDYIANVLLSPKTARSYIQNLRKEIGRDMHSNYTNGRPINMRTDGCEVFTLPKIIKLEIHHIVDMAKPVEVTKPKLNG